MSAVIDVCTKSWGNEGMGGVYRFSCGGLQKRNGFGNGC